MCRGIPPGANGYVKGAGCCIWTGTRKMDAILVFSAESDARRAEQLVLESGISKAEACLSRRTGDGCRRCLKIPAVRLWDVCRLLSGHGIDPQASYLEDTGKPFPCPLFSQALGLGDGDVVSIVGCGGKTALLHRLAMENRCRPVLISTTTKMFRPPEEVVDREHGDGIPLRGVNLLCSPAGEKVGSVAPERLAGCIPPNGLTLLEADGSRGLPLKGWAGYEPVIPPCTTVTVGVCALWPVGRVISEQVVHRPEVFRQLTGGKPGAILTLEHVAAMVAEPAGMFRKAAGRRILLVNQVENETAGLLAEQLAAMLPAGFCTVLAGSVRNGTVKNTAG